MTAKTRKLETAFPEVAIIRKGGAKITKTNAQGKTYQTVGPDLQDKFRAVFMPGCEDLSKKFHEIYKTDQPTVIHAMVPFPSVWRAWEHFNEAYNAGRLIARADDEHYLVLRDPLTGEYHIRDGEPFKAFTPKQVISYERGGKQYDLTVKSAGRLRLWLPALERMVFVTLKTTSYYDCQNINANLAAVQAIADALNGGNAAGIPLLLYRKEQEICWNKPDGSAQRVKKWLVAIEVDPAFVKAAMKRMSHFALTGAQPTGLLAPGEPITGEEDPDLLEEDEEDSRDSDDLPPADAQEGTFHAAPEAQQHPAIDPPVVERQPAAEEAAAEEAVATLAGWQPELVLQAAAHDANGKLARPMTPEVLKAGLQIKAEKQFAGQTPTPKQVNLIAMLIQQVFAGQEHVDKIRHSVTGYLLDAESLKDASGPLLLALLDWMKPTQDKNSSEFFIDAMAAKELSSVWPFVLEQSGQQALF